MHSFSCQWHPHEFHGWLGCCCVEPLKYFASSRKFCATGWLHIWESLYKSGQGYASQFLWKTTRSPQLEVSALTDMFSSASRHKHPQRHGVMSKTRPYLMSSMILVVQLKSLSTGVTNYLLQMFLFCIFKGRYTPTEGNSSGTQPEHRYLWYLAPYLLQTTVL